MYINLHKYLQSNNKLLVPVYPSIIKKKYILSLFLQMEHAIANASNEEFLYLIFCLTAEVTNSASKKEN
jgi:hypothetical protein